MAFTGEDLIEEALGYAGSEQRTADDVLSARRAMYLLMEEWAAQYGATFRVRRYFVKPLPATPGIQLPAGVDDVFDVVVSGVPNPAADDTFTAVTARLTESEYAQISSKLQPGQPSSWYLERTEPPTLYLYPTGAGLAATIWFHEKPGPFDPDANNLEMPRRWHRALVLGTARDVAAKRPWPTDAALMNSHEARIQRLDTWAAQAFAIARPADRQRAPFRVRIA